MARITLRAYNNEINDLIDHGQIEEAISYCRHILKEFPKHVDTYRLLGKAYLEQQRYGDAADILQRVLSSVPDDFISQIGMSIIREDEMNLDAAIYHMELAFESQPSNHAIQDELRRLFAKRDGMEPPRIRLTRGALARMYAHGNLFEQAISEIQAALAEDPNRFDLQTLLANMLNQVDKKVEAAETCTRIIEKLPYNLEANRLLATILKESDRLEEAGRFQKKWEALDPYAAHIKDAFTKSEQVPDDAVTLEREDWEPSFGGDFGDAQPAWATSVGVEIEGEETPQEVPDWLSDSGDSFGEIAPAEPSPVIDSSGGDWMAADASSTESPFGSPDDASAEDDWMSEFSTPAPSGTDETPGSDDWMSEFAAETEQPAAEDPAVGWDTEPSGAEETTPGSEASTIPDFMQDAGWGESEGEDAEQPVSIFDQPDEPIQEGEIPDWMQDMAPTDTKPAGGQDLGALADVKAEADPEWLNSLDGQPQDESPDWLGELDSDADETVPSAEPPSREVDPAGYLSGDYGEDDTDDWLASLGDAQTGAPQQEPETAGEQDWLGSAPADAPPETIDSGGLEIPERDADPAGFLAGDFGEDDTDDWLASLGDAQAAPPQQEQQTAGEEDWPGSVPADSPAETIDSGGLEIPERDADPAGFLAGDFGEDDTDDWLASLSAGQGAAPGAQETVPGEQPAASAADDDWLGSLQSDQSAEPIDDSGGLEIPERDANPAGFLAGDFGEDDTDDWLASLGADQPDGSAGEMPAAGTPVPDAASPSEETADDGMAWMESLAAKQGVAEEELVTSPEERESLGDDFTPDFLSATPDAGQAAGDDDLANLFGDDDSLTPGDAVDEDGDDLSMDWLESISQEAAAEASAGEEPEPAPPTGVPQPAESQGVEDSMDWLTQMGEEAAAPSAESDDLADLFADAEPAAAPPVIEDDDDISMDWLESISKEAAEESAAGEAPPVEADDLSDLFGEGQSAEAAPQPEADPMDWLQDLGEEPPAAAEAESEDFSSLFDGEETLQEDDLSALFGDEQPESADTQEDDLSSLFGEDEPSLEDDLSALFGEDATSTQPQAAPEPPAEEEEDELSLDWLDSIGSDEPAASDAAETLLDEEALADISSLANDSSTEASTDVLPEKPQESAPIAGSSDELDEGLAWLESLAAKKGVAEEELVTSPEERSSFDDDRTPDWLKDIDEDQAQPEAAPASNELDDLDALLAEVDEVTAPPAAEDETVLEDEDDISMDWLDDISQEAAEEAGLDEAALARLVEEDRVLNTSQLSDIFGDDIAPAAASEPPQGPPTDETETVKFEDALDLEAEEETISGEDDTEPEWMKIIQEGEAAKPAAGESGLEDLPADVFPELEESEAVEAAPPTADQTPADLPAPEKEPQAAEGDVLEDQDDFSMDWLDTISQEAAAEAGAGGEDIGAASSDQPEEETPEWLSTIDEEEEVLTGSLDDLDAIFGAEEEAQAPKAKAEETESEDTLVPEWLQEIADDKPASEPAAEPEWLPEVDEPVVEEDIKPVQETEWQPEAEVRAEPPKAKETQAVEKAPEPVPPQPKPAADEALTDARQSMQDGEMETAIKQFTKMIKKGKNLEPVIEEIKEALKRHPVNVELWQVLGDAYMKENNLQDALDAYSKAENLLR